mgnify:FL=1
MKKETLKKFANASVKAKTKRLYQNVTAEEARQSLEAEISALEELVSALDGEQDDSEVVKMVEEQRKALEDLRKSLEEKIAEIKSAAPAAEPFENGRQKFANALEKAVKAGLEAQQTIAKVRFANANNANFNVPYYDEEITLEDRPLPSFLEACRQIPMGGETSVVWNEVESGTNVAAIVAIGGDKPVKTNSTSAATAGANTLAEIVKLPVQYKNAAPVLQDIYEKDLMDDVNEKANAQVQAVIATAANAYSGSVTTVTTPALWQVILAVANECRKHKPSQKVYVWVSSNKAVELDLMTTLNGDPVAVEFASKSIELRTFTPNATYTDDKIFAAVEGKIRFYNDGMDLSTSEHAYWANNQIGIKAEYLNEVIVLRGSDVINTCYDSIARIQGLMTPAPSPKIVTGMLVKTAPTKVTYTDAETLALAGLVVTLLYSDETYEDVAFADFGAAITATPANGGALTTSNDKVVLTHVASTKTASFAITVTAAGG